MRSGEVKVVKVDLELGFINLDTLLCTRNYPTDTNYIWLRIVQDPRILNHIRDALECR